MGSSTATSGRCPLVLLVLVIVAGCGSSDEAVSSKSKTTGCPPAPTGASVADERAGTYRGVELGQGLHGVLEHFEGVPRRWSESIGTPLSGCGQPSLGARTIAAPLRHARMRDVTLTFGGRPARLAEIAVVARGARTRAGVAIGDPIERVAQRYPSSTLDCGREHSSDDTLWKSCRVSGRDVSLYFGGDPINRIEMRRSG